MNLQVRAVAFIILSLFLGGALPPAAFGACFVRGDANLDGRFDISDAVATMGVLFLGQPRPGCDDAMDANDDGRLDISDGIYSLSFLFTGGPAVKPPHPECGEDASGDELGCAAYPSCPPDCAASGCLDQAALDASLAKGIPPLVCLPADAAQFQVGALLVTVCPAELAAPCGEAGEPGCPIRITAARGTLDLPGRTVTLRLEGEARDLPMTVHNQNTGGTTTCSNDLVFGGDAVLPFRAEPDLDGSLIIIEILPGALENVETSLESSGGFACELFESQQDQFREQLIAELEKSAGELLSGLDAELAGARLCAPGR
jgi:hypothetical protein